MGKRRKTVATKTRAANVANQSDGASPGVVNPADNAEGSTASTKPRSKRRKLNDVEEPTLDTPECSHDPPGPVDRFAGLSLEVICQILEFLPIGDVMKMECLSHHLQEAVTLHLRLIIDLDFTEEEIHGWMPRKFTDDTFIRFIKRCPELMFIYGLHFHELNHRRQRRSDVLSIPGIIEALQQLLNLQGLETSDIFLLEAVLNYLPNVEIMGTFKNRNGAFPIASHTPISLTRSAQLTSLHLIGVEVRELPRMDFLKRLHLKWVRFSDPHPFKNFTMPSLRTFVINNCAGPQNALKYVPLMTGLVTARNLTRLELIRVPFLGGLIHHVVEDSWRVSGFRSLHKIVLGACKHAQEADLGYLIVTCSSKLEDLQIQPSLTKDSFFYSLTHPQVSFPKLSSLSLGFVDEFPEKGKWSQTDLAEQGLSEYTENPVFLTDFGMKCVREVFRSLSSLTLYNCPHLHSPMSWLTPGDHNGFNTVTDLCLRRCHAIRLPDFCRFLSLLPCLETLTLEQMFKEPPKGCSRVGLSAGTGLGVSSALVADNGGQNATANQNPANPAENNAAAPPENPGGENNEDDDDDDFVIEDDRELLVDDESTSESESEMDVEMDDNAVLENERKDSSSEDRNEVCKEKDVIDSPEKPTENVKVPSSGGCVQRGGPARRRGIMRCQPRSRQAPSWRPPFGSRNPSESLPEHGISQPHEIPGSSSQRDQMPVSKNQQDPMTGSQNEPDSTSGLNTEHVLDRVNENEEITGVSQQVVVDTVVWSEEMASQASNDNSDSDTNSEQIVKTVSSNRHPKDCEKISEWSSCKNSESSNMTETKTLPSSNIDNSSEKPSEVLPMSTETDSASSQTETAASSSAVASSASSTSGVSGAQNNEGSPKGKSLWGRKKGIMRCQPKSRQAPRVQPDLSSQSDQAPSTGDQVPGPKIQSGPTPSQPECTSRLKCSRSQMDRTSRSESQTDGVLRSRNQSARSPASHRQSFRISRSCQCSSEEIRECTKNATGVVPKKGKYYAKSSAASQGDSATGKGSESIAGAASRKSQKEGVGKGKATQGQEKKTRPEMRHQSTSTSDPVIEDDHTQILSLDCKQLISVTLNHVGLTDVMLVDCPKLQCISGTACRVLRNIMTRSTPKLSRVSFTQCPKLRHEDLVDEIATLPPDKFRLIILRPMNNYCAESMERQIFRTASYKYHVCLVHDHSPDPMETIYNKIRVAAWPDIITTINHDLIKNKRVPDASEGPGVREEFPWRHGMYRMEGLNSNGSTWDMLSDLPWIRTLAGEEDKKNTSYLRSDDKVGVYSPSAKGHCDVRLAVDALHYEIAEIRELNQPLFLQPLIVFVNMCDIGKVVPDPYA